MFKNDSLTEIEVLGLNSQFNLADGHSYLEAEVLFKDVLAELPKTWNFAAKTSVPQMEEYFKNTFAEFHKLEGLKNQKHYSICPTASNSIDVVGAWAQATNTRVGLIEPTFDNLSLLLKRRGVELVSIDEIAFYDHKILEKKVTSEQLGAIFLVNPNNPSGGVVGEAEFRSIVELCAKHSLVLILDTSFRFAHRWILDEYKILQDANIPFIILEDTGKLWPTLDTKASILAYSPDIAPLVRQIYEEVYLCSSNLSLALIGAFIESTIKKGGKSYMHKILESRLNRVEKALEGLPITIENRNPCSLMSVVWLNISQLGISDLEFVRYVQQFQLTILPGRYFYWNSHNVQGQNFVRLALLKPEAQFNHSLTILRFALQQFIQENQEYGSLNIARSV